MKYSNGYRTVAAGILAGLALGASAQAQTSDPVLNALVKKGILTEKEAKDALAESQMQSGALTNRIVLPRGNTTKLMLEGFIQTQAELGTASAYEGQFPGPHATASDIYNSNPRIKFRRARIGAIGEFWDDFDFKIEGDFAQKDGQSAGYNGSNTKPDAFSMTDVFINYHKFEEAQLKVGQFFAPFGYEMLIPDVGPSAMLLTPERSQATESIVPERQIGAQLWGNPLAELAPAQKDLLNYRVGIFNGDNRNLNVHNNSNFMYAGRIESIPFTGKLFGQDVKWRVGVNGVYFDAGAGTTIAQIGNPLVNPDGSMAGLTLPANAPARERSWGVDQTLTIGQFAVSAEYLENSLASENANNIIAAQAPAFPGGVALPGMRSVVMNGYYVQPSYYIWDKKLQLVAKWESFNPGQNAHDNISTITGGINWYIHQQNVVAMLDYMHTWSQFRADNPGYGPSNFNEVMLRLELYF